MLNFEEYMKIFNSYVEGFEDGVDDVTKRNINLKIKHTYRTVNVMKRLAESEEMNEEDTRILKIIALFHDLGRFNQLKKFGHFNDLLSINHGEESVRELKRLKILDFESIEDKELIFTSILNHNKDRAKVEIKNERELLFSKFIRDADKCDIYRVCLEEQEHFQSADSQKSLMVGFEKSSDMSLSVFKKMMAGELVGYKDLVTTNDKIMWQLYWMITDLDFKESFKIVHENSYLEKLFESYKKYSPDVATGRSLQIYNRIKNVLESLRIYIEAQNEIEAKMEG